MPTEAEREQVTVRTMFYGDIEAACEVIDSMGREAVDVEGILNDLTAQLTAPQGGAPQSKLVSLVMPLRKCRRNLNEFKRLCKAYQNELRRHEEEAEAAREAAFEPLDDEEDKAPETTKEFEE